jgi:hypothetical protein
MGVRLDAAGHREETLGRDNPRRGERSIIGADENDPLVRDPDRPRADRGGRDDLRTVN